MKLNREKVMERVDELGMSLTELGEKAGIKKSALSHYLHHRSICPWKKIQNIADVLDVDYLEIVDHHMY